MSELVEFRMPDVGEGIAQAEVLEWLISVGEPVAADQAMVQVETDKSIVEIPAPAAGTLLKQCVPVGEFAQVEELLAVIGDVGAVDNLATDTIVVTPGEPSVGTGQTAGAVLVPPSGPTARRRRPMASPRTRRIAVQRGIDLAAIVGTGPHGRILEADLDGAGPAGGASIGGVAASRPRVSAQSRDEVIEVRGLRRSIARSMTEALTIPHVTEFREVDATNLLAARRVLKPVFEAKGLRLSVLPILLKAVLRALTIQPTLNATYDPATEALTRPAGVHLGIATATADGLIVPVIHDAELLTLGGLASEVGRLAERARTRTATADELTGGSFTVTNFGSFGTWLGTPVIRPPEVGIAGFGRITDKVIAVDGRPEVRPILPIVVATDHRINDGAHLAGFVNAVADAVAQPLLLLS